MKNNYTVYKHTAPNGKVYIGITRRKPIYRWDNGYGYKNNKHFFKAIKKYGWENIKHEILYENLSKEDACKKEMELIAFYKSNQREYGYNKSIGGENSATGFHHTEETKKRIAKTLSIKNKGIIYSKETREKMSKARLGKPMSEETKRKKSKPVLCIETNIVYYGINEACRQTGVDDGCIGLCVKGKRKTAGGYHWRYYNERYQT